MKAETQALIQEIYESQYNTNYLIPGPYGDRYITYADYIASGQPLRIIEEYIENTILPTYANTHTEASFTGLQTSKYREEAREIIKSSVNASEEDALIFAGSGSTGAIDLLIRKLTQFYITQDIFPVVLIGPYEHHSNILPWREGPFELVEIPMATDGNVDLKELEIQLSEYKDTRPMIGSFSAASNVTGIISPVAEIHSLLKKYGALSFWDYAGAAPYVDIDMNPDAAVEPKDAIYMSTHKLIGGPGTPGVLIAKKSLFSVGLPVVKGGGTVRFVTKTFQSYFEDIETREEGGTPAILGSIRAGMSFKLKDMVGAQNIEKIEANYIKEAIKIFNDSPNVFVLGSLNAERLGFLAFNIRYRDNFLHYNFVVALLNDLFGIQSRGGCSCAGPYGHDLLGLDDEQSSKYINELSKGNEGSKPGWVRLNFNYFIPRDEFDYLVKSLIWISENGWKLMNAYYFDDNEGLWTSKSEHKVAVNTLSDFLTTDYKLKKGSSVDRAEQRETYFKIADEIAADELAKLDSDSFQEYNYTQIDNPMRWYSLVQDIDLSEV